MYFIVEIINFLILLIREYLIFGEDLYCYIFYVLSISLKLFFFVYF